MKKFILAIILIPYLALGASLSGIGTSYLRLEPSALPATCRLGDIRTDIGSSLVKYCNGSNTWAGLGGGAGSVTSVGLTVPSFLSVTGSPITTSGTFALSLSGTALPAANGGTGVVSTATFPTSGTVQAITPNQYGVLLSGSGTTASVLAPDASTTKVLTSGGLGANPTWQTFAGTGTSTPTANTNSQWDANKNLSSNSFLSGYTTTATAAGTTTLTVASTQQQYFTGSTTQTVVLPVTSTLVLGQSFYITNNSTGIVTVNSSGSNQVIQVGANSSAIATCILTSGTTAASWSATVVGGGGFVQPTITKLTSGSSTYTTPANVSYIHVRMVGGGGGGGASGTAGSGGAGGTGGTTTFGTSLLTATGGVGGVEGAGTGGAGGTPTLNAPAIGTALSGAIGSGGSYTNTTGGYWVGSTGASSPFGGGGGGGKFGAGQSAAANTGAGGGGGGTEGTNSTYTGASGGSGADIDAIIPSPSATYSYSVGVAGTAGHDAGGKYDGGAGGSGYIEITEYYYNGAIGTATNVTGVVALANLSTNVLSTGGTSERVERARIAAPSAGSCAVNSMSGTFISGTPSSSGTGVCTIAFSAGLFSAEPSCTVGTDTSAAMSVLSSKSSTGVTVSTLSSGGAAANSKFDIICMGPK